MNYYVRTKYRLTKYIFLTCNLAVFKYRKGNDSVLVVGEDDYNKCNKKNPIHTLTDGYSKFKLTRSGPFFFISGHDQRCENGQKLTTVVPSGHHSPSSTAHSPSPSVKTPSHAPPLHPPSHSPSPAAHKDSLPLPHSPSPITPAHAPPPSNSSPSPSPTAQTPSQAPLPSHTPSPSAHKLAPPLPHSAFPRAAFTAPVAGSRFSPFATTAGCRPVDIPAAAQCAGAGAVVSLIGSDKGIGCGGHHCFCNDCCLIMILVKSHKCLCGFDVTLLLLLPYTSSAVILHLVVLLYYI